jgi:hypothetical protein
MEGTIMDARILEQLEETFEKSIFSYQHCGALKRLI